MNAQTNTATFETLTNPAWNVAGTITHDRFDERGSFRVEIRPFMADPSFQASPAKFFNSRVEALNYAEALLGL